MGDFRGGARDGPPRGGALRHSRRALRARAHGRAAAAKERAASVAAERLAGARTVRTFAAEDREAERYAEALEEAARARRIATRIHALHLALFAAVPSTAVAAWLWYGGRLVERGRLTVGELTTVVPLALEVANALAGLSELHAEVNKGVDAADRAAAVLSARQVIEVDARRRLLAAVDPPANGNENFPGNETPGGESRGSSSSTSDALPRVMRGAIEFRDVRFAYPSRPDRVVLDALNLTLAPGEVFALVGPSGGGKSTVGALLERFYDPAEGDVLVDGVRVSDLDPRWLRRNVGAVSQDPTLFAGTVAENIAYARPNAAREEIVAAAKAANAHEFVSRFPDGYETRVGERGAGLSGGQRQRIAIARVLLADPAVLLLDEATSALDARSERAVTEALERAARGRTTLLVAHRLSTVRRAHRVGVLKDGQLVECGTHEELMRKGGSTRISSGHNSPRDDEKGRPGLGANKNFSGLVFRRCASSRRKRSHVGGITSRARPRDRASSEMFTLATPLRGAFATRPTRLRGGSSSGRPASLAVRARARRASRNRSATPSGRPSRGCCSLPRCMSSGRSAPGRS